MKTKVHHYVTGFDMIAIGSGSSKNPVVQGLLKRVDPLLVLLGFQTVGFIAQVILFLLPLTLQQQQWLTVAGLINVLLTASNTFFFLNKHKSELP